MTEAHRAVDTGSQLAATLAEYGLLAASAHNTQPWFVSIDGARLRIFPDRSRQLVADPTGRELFLALGCFWGNVRLAARALGLQIRETVSGELVEIIVEGAEGERDEATLSAIRTRRNNRFPLTGPLDESLLACGAADGLEVCVITDSGRKGAVADIVRDAFAASTRDPRFRAELAQWVRSNTSSAKDGMPGYVMGIPTPLSYLMPILLRLPTPPALARQERSRTDSAPAVVAICGEDHQGEWIKAGRVFQELAVRLEMDGVTTAMSASPIRDGGIRGETPWCCRSHEAAAHAVSCGAADQGISTDAPARSGRHHPAGSTRLMGTGLGRAENQIARSLLSNGRGTKLVRRVRVRSRSSRQTVRRMSPAVDRDAVPGVTFAWVKLTPGA